MLNGILFFFIWFWWIFSVHTNISQNIVCVTKSTNTLHNRRNSILWAAVKCEKRKSFWFIALPLLIHGRKHCANASSKNYFKSKNDKYTECHRIFNGGTRKTEKKHTKKEMKNYCHAIHETWNVNRKVKSAKIYWFEVTTCTLGQWYIVTEGDSVSVCAWLPYAVCGSFWIFMSLFFIGNKQKWMEHKYQYEDKR